MTRANSEIDDYLKRYAATLTSFDSKAAAALWTTPGMIVDDRFAGVVADRDVLAQGLEQTFPTYRKLGLASVSHECLDIDDLTELLKLIKVCWYFYDADGVLLTDSTAYYLVRRGESGYQACVCIQTDDAEKLQALAAERGVDLADAAGNGD